MKINKEIISKCKDAKLQTVLNRLLKFNAYYSLLNGGVDAYVRVFDIVGKVPEQIKEWLKIFDGGFLFSVSMLSTIKNVPGQGEYLSFKDINSPDYKKENNIPQEIVCFAMTNYGNYYFFDSDSQDGRIYEWDSEECVAVEKWDSFADWLDTQIDNAEADIKAGLLDPMED